MVLTPRRERSCRRFGTMKPVSVKAWPPVLTLFCLAPRMLSMLALRARRRCPPHTSHCPLAKELRVTTLLEIALRAAREAGDALKQAYARPHEIKSKGLRDIATEADLEAGEEAGARDLPTGHLRDGPSAFVTVLVGCDRRCSYCVVPSVRGREWSRPAREVVEEVRRLADAGVKDVTLLGQSVMSYGRANAVWPDGTTRSPSASGARGLSPARGIRASSGSALSPGPGWPSSKTSSTGSSRPKALNANNGNSSPI